LFEETAATSSSSLLYGFRIAKPKDKGSDWACEDLNTGKEWLIALEGVAANSHNMSFSSSSSSSSASSSSSTTSAKEGSSSSGGSKKTRRFSSLSDVTQNQGVAVSCDMFEMHPVFGFTQCRTCGVSKQQHFNPKTLASLPKYEKIISWPLNNTREGWLYVRKKHSKMSDLRFGDWKRR
jgi:hypothetical protein